MTLEIVYFLTLFISGALAGWWLSEGKYWRAAGCWAGMITLMVLYRYLK